MPIQYNFKTNFISEDDFHAIDYQVMGLVFSIHRELGRFWNEKIYQNELADRCQKAGFEKVATEVPVQVSYKDFHKSYYVDLILNDAVIYELKAVQALSGEHLQQALHYLFLLNTQHGKLVNMRPTSVEHRFVSTKLTRKKRFNFTIEDEHWQQLDEDSLWLKKLVVDLLNEWGAFLDTELFYNAIHHFRGGKELVAKKIKVMNGTHLIGTQNVHLINPATAFKISSMTKDEYYYEEHLHRFLQFTSLSAFQWINFKHDRIIFKTIFK